MRLETLRRRLDECREIEQRFYHLLLFGLAQHIELHAFRCNRRRIDAANAKDSAYSRVRHLDVVDGVFL